MSCECLECGCDFIRKSNRQLFCSVYCRESYYVKHNPIYNEKVCSYCGVLKSCNYFYKDKTKRGGLSSKCINCRSIYRRKYYWNNPELARYNTNVWRINNKSRKNFYEKTRKALISKSTPVWADFCEIEYIYRLAGERNLEVDHIVPLQSKLVCGLHTGDNLRCIPRALNQVKHNKYWPDMPEE